MTIFGPKVNFSADGGGRALWPEVTVVRELPGVFWGTGPEVAVGADVVVTSAFIGIVIVC